MAQLNDVQNFGNTLIIERRNPRRIVEAEIFIRQSDTQIFRATLSDLSVSGFKMTSYTGVDDKKPIYIRLPGIQTLGARVIWSDHQDYGCAFQNVLHPAVLDHLAQKINGM
ncbi:MAG: PilZ domain-containing protein [Parasphingorhabdus sp.]|uniref:PilZ domain-containing protein n=1 Tax=Parasphingorhabdus sp. TaxID=2709688 RepID=UPI003297D2CF